MALVQNVTNEEITIKVCGNWFTFKKGQSKILNDDLAQFIQVDRKDAGLMVLPREFEEDAELRNTEEGKATLEQLKNDALRHYIDRFRAVVHNNQVSMRRDLEMANIKADPSVYASEGELTAMRLVASYQMKDKDQEAEKAAEVKKLMEQIKQGEKAK